MAKRGKNPTHFIPSSLGSSTTLVPVIMPPSAFINAVWGQLDEKKPPPEPTTPPRTVVGLTGYRLYTLNDELYLVGARSEIQKGQASEQAKHEQDEGFIFLDTTTGKPVKEAKEEGHRAPGWGCLCGYGAHFWPTSLEEPDWNNVLAEVQAGGRTIISETGWRAERIVLTKLWVACPIMPAGALRTLGERYEVPVEVLR